jgi:hypothetical protein
VDFHGGVTGGSKPRVHSAAVFDADGAGGDDPALYVAGEFTSAGGVTVSSVARWDGSSWSDAGGGVAVTIFDLLVFDDDGAGPNPERLFATGTFNFGSGFFDAVAYLDGSTWTLYGSAFLQGGAFDIDVWDPDAEGPLGPTLVAGGRMSFGSLRACIGYWTGSAWAGVGTGRFQYVSSIAVLDEDGEGPASGTLYICGDFNVVNSVSYNGVARWSGTQWEPLEEGVESRVASCTVFDDDAAGPNPPALFCAGPITSAGAYASQSIARWGATAAPEVTSEPSSIIVEEGATATLDVVASEAAPTSAAWQKNGGAVTDDDRVAGSLTSRLTISDVTPGDAGTYAVACGSDTSQDVTITVVPPPACLGDLDADGDTDVLDFAIFIPAFGSALGDPQYLPDADFDSSGTIDVLDFALFAPDFGCMP